MNRNGYLQCVCLCRHSVCDRQQENGVLKTEKMEGENNKEDGMFSKRKTDELFDLNLVTSKVEYILKCSTLLWSVFSGRSIRYTIHHENTVQ